VLRVFNLTDELYFISLWFCFLLSLEFLYSLDSSLGKRLGLTLHVYESRLLLFIYACTFTVFDLYNDQKYVII